MNTLESIQYLWPTWHVFALEAFLTFVGALLLSAVLNRHEREDKLRNVGKAVGWLYGPALLAEVPNALAEQPPLVWPILLASMVLVMSTLADLTAYALDTRHQVRYGLIPKASAPRPMWRQAGIALALLGVVLWVAACTLQLQTLTPGVGTLSAPPGTEPSAEPSRAPTRTPTATPSSSPTPTPILSDALPDVPDHAPAVFYEDFDGAYTPRLFPEINVEESVEPFYCDTPYTPERCRALRRGSGNPDDLMMGRPEYKPTDLAERILSGKAQQWFCFWRVCDAGVYAVVHTPPGAVCEVEAHVQTWSARSEYGFNGADWVKWGSDSGTLDDQANSTWYIRIDLSGGANAFAPGLPGMSFSYSTGHYDRYAPITYRFRAAGDETTVFIGNVRLWPLAHNDNYLDLLTVRCLDPDAPPTPQPGNTPEPTPTATPEPRPNDPAVQVLEDGAQFTPYGNSHIREGHTIVARSVGGLLPNVSVDAYAVWSGVDGSLWVCLDPAWTWVASPDYDLNILVCSRWTAWRYGGIDLGRLD